MASLDVRDDRFTSWAKPLAVAEQSGKVLALVGVLEEHGSDHFDLVRFTANGKVDTTFGSSGRVRIDVRQVTQNATLRVLTNGKLEFAGVIGGQITMARFSANGTPDDSLVPGGVKFMRLGAPELAGGNKFTNGPQSLAMESDGSLAVVAEAYDRTSPDYQKNSDALRPKVIRFTVNGKLDKNFSGDAVADDLAGKDHSLISIALPGDGEIVVGGASYVHIDENNSAALALIGRFKPDGTLDKSFGRGAYQASQGIGDSVISQLALSGPFGNEIGAIAGTTRLYVFARINGKPLKEYGQVGILLRHQLPSGLTGPIFNQLAFDQQDRLLVVDDGTIGRVVDHPTSEGSTSEGTLTIAGSSPNDTIRVTQTPDNRLVVSRDSIVTTYEPNQVNNLYIASGSGDDRIVVGSGKLSGDKVDQPLVGHHVTVNGGSGNDDITLITRNSDISVLAGDGDDRVQVNYTDRHYAAIVHGENGNDYLGGGAGAQSLYGDGGDDSLFGAGGSDRLDGGDGDDLIVSKDGEKDLLFGGRGNESALIDNGLDVLDGIESVS
jgi:Ca2+-binding RTX toxin-like protein